MSRVSVEWPKFIVNQANIKDVGTYEELRKLMVDLERLRMELAEAINELNDRIDGHGIP